MNKKYYAVLVGENGPNVYDCPIKYRQATSGVSGASGKSFDSRIEAEKWLRHSLSLIQNGIHRWVGDDGAAEYARAQDHLQNRHPIQDGHSAPPVNQIPVFPPPPYTPPALPQQQNPPPAQYAPGIELSEQQLHVMKLVQEGNNIFFTGPAGTGKSVLLREIIRFFRKDPARAGELAITASTGIAGLNIGGTTLHSFAGVGLGKEPVEHLVKRIMRSMHTRQRWLDTQVLIIDEISMVDGTLFDKLETIAREVRERAEPFGGIQLIISGDFCQLPPVPDKTYDHRQEATFAFDAWSWARCISQTILLTKVFRQKENSFVEILSAMRTGELRQDHINQLRRLDRPLRYNDGIEPSYLYPLRSQVEGCNITRLNALPDPSWRYEAMDSAGYSAKGEPISRSEADILLERLVALREITLKVGAQVMLIRNVEQGHLVNGSLGKVTEFITTREALQRKIAIASRASESGSRQQEDEISIPQPELRPLNDSMFGPRQPWPLVQFTNGMELLCCPVDFSVEGYVGNVEAYRLQVPLILAWALSIHKSQGQTLQRVKVDLDRIFEKGQAYVALSRATSMEGLEIQNFSPAKVRAHPRVIQWQASWMPALNPCGSSHVATRPRSSHDDYEEMDSMEAIIQYHGSVAPSRHVG